MNRSRSLAGTLLAAGVAAAACSDSGPAMPVALSAISFDTVYEIGASSGDGGARFQGIWSVEVDPDGHLAVFDLGGPAIHLYDEAGAHIGSIEETGLEPGQLDRPSGMSWAEPGSLLVWDPGSSWVSRFELTGGSVEYVERFRAFAFGETGFCARGHRAWLSYFQDGQVVHEIGPEGVTGSFGSAPQLVGGDALGPDLLEIATEELTPSALLCTGQGVLDVSFVQAGYRLHDEMGTETWARNFEDFSPIEVYTPDGIGLGRAFDGDQGSHLLRSVVPWGEDMALVQHELRLREVPEEGETPVFESRLIRLSDGAEIDRTRDLPLVLATGSGRLYLVGQDAPPRVTAVRLH